METEKEKWLKRLYSIQESAVYLGCSKDTIRELVSRGELPFVRWGKKHFCDRRDMDRFIESNKAIA